MENNSGCNLPATPALIGCEELPLKISMDFNKIPSETKIIHRDEDGNFQEIGLDEAAEISEEAYRGLAKDTKAFEAMGGALDKVVEVFQELGTTMPSFHRVKLPGGSASKYRHQEQQKAVKAWKGKKARRKLQANSRKRNRS